MNKFYTISQINAYIKAILQKDRNLNGIWACG